MTRQQWELLTPLALLIGSVGFLVGFLLGAARLAAVTCCV